MGSFGHALALENWAFHNSVGCASCFAESCAKVSKLSQTVFAVLKLCANPCTQTFWNTFDALSHVSMSLQNVPETQSIVLMCAGVGNLKNSCVNWVMSLRHGMHSPMALCLAEPSYVTKTVGETVGEGPFWRLRTRRSSLLLLR